MFCFILYVNLYVHCYKGFFFFLLFFFLSLILYSCCLQCLVVENILPGIFEINSYKNNAYKASPSLTNV